MIGLVLDCRDPEALANFWSEALGYVNVGFADPYVMLLPAEGAVGPQLLLQKVADPKAGKNRMHLDIHTPDIDSEKDRLVGLGATVLEPAALEAHGERWWVMADPEGNEFCVCSGGG